jgi:hypothetical protein
MKSLNSQTTMSAYNKQVKGAYFKVLKQLKLLLATIERHELRCTLQKQDQSKIVFSTTVHEIFSPLAYLSLQCRDGERFTIHFGVEQLIDDLQYSYVTTGFVRILYKLTSSELTAINIEDCVNVEYIITSCSELYEVVEDRNSTYEFSLIKHKPAAMKRKQMAAVA